MPGGAAAPSKGFIKKMLYIFGLAFSRRWQPWVGLMGRLYLVHNAATWMLRLLSRFEQITTIGRDLHWLPVIFPVRLKLAVIAKGLPICSLV
ncbi:hypothetical protein FKM82_022796 [Ascaphus truei]